MKTASGSMVVVSVKGGIAGLALLVLACGPDCFEIKRLGDFEYSQGNYANAIRHYERALAADSACAGVKEKRAEARSRNR